MQGNGNSGTHEFGHQLGLKHLEQMSSSTNPPSIMLTEAYNKWVDAKYTKNLKDGTIVFDVSKRKVTQKDIDNIGLSKLKFVNGKANVGNLTNLYHEPAKE